MDIKKTAFQNNIRKIVFYVVVFIIFLILICLSNEVFYSFEKIDIINNRFLIQLLFFVIYCVMGMIIGLENLLAEKRKKGKWHFKFARMLIWGLPILLIIFPIWLFYYGEYMMTTWQVAYYSLSFNARDIFGFIFGYILLTGFYKVEIPSETNNL